MPTQKRLTLSLPEGIGLASRFGKAPLRFVRIKNGSLQNGDLLLQLTLKELGVIRKMSKDVQVPRLEFFEDAQSQYDALQEELEKLENALRSTSIFNFAKRLEIRRQANDFVEAGHELYVTVKSTSDKMQRRLLSCTSQVEEEDGDIPPGEQVRGIALTDATGPLDDEQASIVTDPFDDRHALDNRIIFQNIWNILIGCVNADNSDARGITMNNNTKN